MSFLSFCLYYCICTFVAVTTLCLILRFVFKFRLHKLSKRIDDSLEGYFKNYFEFDDDDFDLRK